MSENILTGVYPENDYRYYLRHNEQDMKYGLPDKKKYPMPDRDHVMSAIKFFNYVSPADEKELARNILNRIREYGITDINVGENNRFGKYYKPDYLEHHGILGMKWGIRRFQDKNGSLTAAGKKRYDPNNQKSNAEIDNNLSTGKVLEKNGYKLNYSFDDGDEWYEKSYKNPKCFRGEMTSVINVRKSDSVSDINAKINSAKDFVANFDKHDLAARDSITKDIYDDGARNGWTEWLPEKSTFKKDIKCYGFIVDSPNDYRLNYDDGGHLGGHSLDVEYDKAKKKSSYVAMNG